MIKVTITSNEINKYHLFLDMIHLEGQNTSVIFLPKIHNQNRITKRKLNKPKLRVILQNKWPVLFKNARS